MKVTSFYTTTDADFVKNPIFPSEKLGGTKTVIRTDKVINRDFKGSGVAITGSSCYNLSLMNADERRNFIESVYGENGLGLSVARLSIGASDYSAELYTYDDVPNDLSLEHFSIDRDRAYVIPMIKEILAVKPDLYLFASPWSPPGWMKTEGKIGGGYMRREFIDCYAEYFVRFIKAYAKEGIKISAVTPQNEPETDQFGLMPACIWHPDIQAEFVIALRKKLDENGLDTEIWLYDHCFSRADRVKWMLDTHKGLAEATSAIAFHYYEGAIEQTLELAAAYPKLRLHFTEGGPRLYDHYDSDWCKWGIMLSKAINCGYGSFTGWNLMLDQFGGPNVGPFFCGGLVTRNNQTGELTRSGQYKTFSHIAKFMKPGAVAYKLEVTGEYLLMSEYPGKKIIPLEAACVENTDGSICYFLSNAYDGKRQVQLFENGQWYYVELLPNTLCTVVFEKD